MRFKLTLFLFISAVAIGYSQQTEFNNSILYSPNNFLKYDSSSLKFTRGMLQEGGLLIDGEYDLANLLPGLFLRPEHIIFDSPFLQAYGSGYTLKYYIGESDVYITGGLQSTMYMEYSGERSYYFGFNVGVGYNLSKNTQIEGRTFQSFKSYSTGEAFQPVQLTPMQPISLGIKTKF
ncbi:hypothetical protein C8P64_1370 [Christiangramia gaetbulicola]|uniref:Uncharacterized protein n=1 Tax=Christiangramia gaetbulicola TaxID=703340 RepID=A0A2T6AG87_9FLAO|nr:hypothetical protein [Christiangramia gaetbulicola]PTX42848.1 hypothetical protein C8P64_1370 [Christiangramia gaetbulicola]